MTHTPAEAADRPVVVGIAGTDHHRFDRLVTWLDRWAEQRDGVTCIVQHGTSKAPTFARGVQLVAHDELLRLVGRASAVVCHGGPGAITEARAAGLLPIVVPRDPRLGEHVDGHQQRFAALMSGKGLIRVARSGDELGRLLDDALAAPRPRPETDPDSPQRQAVERFALLVRGLLPDAPAGKAPRRARKVVDGTQRHGE